MFGSNALFGRTVARLLLVGAAALLAQGVPGAAQTESDQGAGALAQGEERERVGALCTSCHQPRVITQSSGYTRAHWDVLIATMAELGSEDEKAVLDYLAEHYPPSHNPRAAKLVEGPLEISFEEWAAQQLGQRPRDPVEAPDGAIWYVGQQGNTIGRIDPQTDDVREWPLPDGALPHSVNVDAEGGVWYMGNGNGTIAKFDPATGATTEHKMPDPRFRGDKPRDPHTAEIDQGGVMWFTLQQSNMIGRFDPKSGDIRLVTIAREGARPYGIKIAADGTPWVACNGSKCLIRVNPETMDLSEIDLPHEATTVRRLDIAADGMIWYVNSGRGKLGRYNPESGEIREWDSPSGPGSHPYAIAVIDGIVWYTESGVRPELLVRFDPATESFQSWPILSAGLYTGIVRHMRATRDGKLLLHQGGTNRIIRATLPPAG